MEDHVLVLEVPAGGRVREQQVLTDEEQHVISNRAAHPQVL